MDIEKLIEQLRYLADTPSYTAFHDAKEREIICDQCEADFCYDKQQDAHWCMYEALSRAATALSTLQAENEKLRETVDKYATAARVIALHLKPFCDESLPYDEMIADAARKASDELEQVKQERDAAIKELDEVTSEVDDLADFVDREIHPVIDYNLYLDLRENVDAVSMFQHEDEWRGLHKEE